MNPFGVCRYTVSYRHHFKQHNKKPPQLPPPSSSSISPVPSQINCCTTNNSTNNTINDGHSQTDAQDKTDINNRVEYGGVHAYRHSHNHNHICCIYSIYCFIMQGSTHSCIFSRPFSFHSALFHLNKCGCARTQTAVAQKSAP